MFRFSRYCDKLICQSNSLFNYQLVRTVRKLRGPCPKKPFWIGLARSKKFIVKHREVPPPVEQEVNHYLIRNYQNQMNSLRYFFEGNEVLQAAANKKETIYVNEDVIEESLLRNEQWNAETAALREKRLAKKFADKEETILHLVGELEKKENAKKQAAKKLIEEEASHEFITEENLEKAIDDCLNNIVDYNFVIDLKGNKHTQLFAEPFHKVSTVEKKKH